MPDVTLECLDALELLLKKDPRERITLFDFLHHPWLQAHQKWRNRKIWNDCYSSSSSSLHSTLKTDEEEPKGTLSKDESAGDEKQQTQTLGGVLINKGELAALNMNNSEVELGTPNMPYKSKAIAVQQEESLRALLSQQIMQVEPNNR